MSVGCPPHVPTCIHTHTCMHMCNTKIYMYRNCKWLPPWRHQCQSCLTCMYVCGHVCMHACVHVCGGRSHPFSPAHPPTQPPTHPKGTGTSWADTPSPLRADTSLDRQPPSGSTPPGSTPLLPEIAGWSHVFFINVFLYFVVRKHSCP